MGGSIRVPGNIESDWPAIHNRVAEWNIWVDPTAAREVFESGVPLHITPLDATRTVVWASADVDGWESAGSPAGTTAGSLLRWMLRSWSPTGVFAWDLVAAVLASDPGFGSGAQLAVDVVVAPGPEQGRTVTAPGAANATVCLEVDARKVAARAAQILGSGQATERNGRS